jgi:biopolymer transport protein ExbD
VSNQPIDLRRALRDEAGEDRDIPITIAADGEAAHRFVVTALDAANALGFRQLTIAAQTPSGANG